MLLMRRREVFFSSLHSSTFNTPQPDNDDSPRPDQFSASANRRCPPPARCAPKQCQLSAKPINVPGAFQLLKILQLHLCRQTCFSNPLLPPTSLHDKTPRCPSPARRSARRCQFSAEPIIFPGALQLPTFSLGALLPHSVSNLLPLPRSSRASQYRALVPARPRTARRQLRCATISPSPASHATLFLLLTPSNFSPCCPTPCARCNNTPRPRRPPSARALSARAL